MVKEFHEKCQVGIKHDPQLIKRETSLSRYKMMQEEVEEYLQGVEKEDLSNVAKELCDILYTTYGTILEHGLQDKMEDIFAEVHRSNMIKEFGLEKAKKGESYSKADISKFLLAND